MNRSRELDTLERWGERPANRLAIVWGRRRVGKTALLRRFAGPGRAVFHTGAGRGEPAELSLLSRAVAGLNDLPGTRDLLARPYVDWDDALDHLADVAARTSLLVVLDEFPELVATSPQLPNVLRGFLDRSAGHTKLRLVVCGSAVRRMQALGEERSPLFGRAELILPVHPFHAWEAAAMLPGLAPTEQAVVYGLLGGVPLYLSWWDTSMSLRDNILALATEPGARLLTEGDLVLATEAESGDYPSAVLYAIAAGATRHNEIAAAIGADPTRTFERLIAVQLVERLRPVTDGARTRRRIYRIADNFLRFHLGLLGRYRSQIDGGLGRGILPALIESLDDHLGPVWESMVRAHLTRAAADGTLGDQIVAVGPWWAADGRTEIDAVALQGRARTPIVAAEVKWAKSADGARLARDLARRAEAVPHMIDDPLLVVAARERITHRPRGVMAITAADVFRDS